MTLSMPTVEDCFLPLLRVLAAGGEPMVEQAVLQAAKQEGFSALPSIFHIQTDKRGVPLIQRRIAWAKFYLNAVGILCQAKILNGRFFRIDGNGRGGDFDNFIAA